jgi:hypothetical protein
MMTKITVRMYAAFLLGMMSVSPSNHAIAGTVKGRVVDLQQLGVSGVLVEALNPLNQAVLLNNNQPVQVTTKDADNPQAPNAKQDPNKGKFTLSIPDNLIAPFNFRVALRFSKNQRGEDRVLINLDFINGASNDSNIQVVQPLQSEMETEHGYHHEPTVPDCNGCYIEPVSRFFRRRWHSR